ncbi:DNA gyrase subunit A [Campylobacter hyointestinalis]|uniref:DNA gyrase subunit A n=1 Tax=Campylobacter hyointestinalis subsp. hyointestinalis TaxID=91352 RepID=A0A855N3T3_CAMHY|nr:DNA gyrase subunit A [Campylobacter hyointestinalis]PPB59762.1 DNA gyrase subunit A [Campylobacter hyointestinalis subsp. hyointestinalis]PPB64597.1 DNA gyrase subunit A [Campylobacter hyointestinalis subsp. hyointestinalis]PPB72401.1 DNA gyrase subunit A [Campylobacter hyointestinalis subsp. hyointestinalis]PPB74204.1 DNA gyrase subunit A [Campylobacter hyointestinalis subsp. hyointestinalis]PPB75122.1 DNA gyrase subunit A [Campylobacter hyointestinalis subsp. hyointestinalis]
MEENIFNTNQDIDVIDVEDSIKTSYLDYSMSVIIGRALPDARDGLKPVHRRILYAMNDLGVGSRSPYKKSARIVGDVIGKYHPHGDTAVYDALVRMAQSFSMRVPAVDGQGNFGSVDGDGAAAMRYTEARMTVLAEELLRDLDKDTVDFIPNYDDSLSEPDVLPARVPNLLLNGSSGIAVGMATNIPPHSLDELIDGLLVLLDDKEVSLDQIMTHIKGPDFPTGGIIFGKKGILEAYKTGRGRIKLRAKTHIEKKPNKDVIVVDELPYQVNKAKLHSDIADLVKDKVIDGISEIRDESDRDGIRLVIELKRDAMSEIVLNNLFKSTQMEVTFGVIMLAINNKEPKVFSLMELLRLFLNHRKTVIIRRTIFELQKARARAHILEGLKIALDNIDAVINLIKTSADTNSARDGLMAKFGLSELQSNAILDMRLSKLTGLEREKLEAELKEILELIEKLDAILKSETLIENIIREELLEIKSKFKCPRITEIVDDYDDIDIEDLIPNENMVVTITHRGYIKRVPSKSYEKQKRGGKGKVAVTTYEDDFIESFFTCMSHDTLMFVTDRGQLYWLKVYKIPEGSRTAKGKAVVNLIQLQADEKIKAIIPTTDFDESKSLAFFTKNGIVKRTNLSEFKNIRSIGVKAINLDENDELVTVLIANSEPGEFYETRAEGVEDDENSPEVLNDEIEGDDDNSGKMLFIVTKKGMCIKFALHKVRQIGRVSRGVTGIRFKEAGDEVVGAVVIENDSQEILSVSQKGIGKRTTADEYRLQSRGGKGVICMKLTPKTKELVGVVMVDEEMDLMALTSSGKMIRVDMQSIRKAGRNTSGVIVVNVEGDEVVSIARCPKEESDDEILESEIIEESNLE